LAISAALAWRSLGLGCDPGGFQQPRLSLGQSFSLGPRSRRFCPGLRGGPGFSLSPGLGFSFGPDLGLDLGPEPGDCFRLGSEFGLRRGSGAGFSLHPGSLLGRPGLFLQPGGLHGSPGFRFSSGGVLGSLRLRRGFGFSLGSRRQLSLALFGGSQRRELRPQILELGGDRLGLGLLSLARGLILSLDLLVDVGLHLREARRPALAVARGHAILGHRAREPFGDGDL
jgi:hypothetical protein